MIKISIILTKFSNFMFIVKTPMSESLADYVRRVRNQKNISTQKVAEFSKGGITDGYVSRIENGYIKNVSPEKLQALAKGLGVPEDEVFTAARGTKPKGSRLLEEIMSYISELSASRQRDMLRIAKTFYDEAVADKQTESSGTVVQVPKEIKHEIRRTTKPERKKVNGK